MIIGTAAALLALIIYALIDCARTESSRLKGVSKPGWIFIIILFPVIGALMWLFLGKHPENRSSFGPAAPKVPKAPDNDTEYLNFLDARAKREAESRRREEEHEAELDAKLDAELRRIEEERRSKPDDSSEQ